MVGLAQDRRRAVKIYPGMPAAEKKRGAEGEFLAKDLSIWRQTPGLEADACSGSRIQEGENETCFKCGGTGFYEKRMISAVTYVTLEGSISSSEVTFSNDYRGGIYGIRENGRFESSPLEDDYDE